MGASGVVCKNKDAIRVFENMDGQITIHSETVDGEQVVFLYLEDVEKLVAELRRIKRDIMASR